MWRKRKQKITHIVFNFSKNRQIDFSKGPNYAKKGDIIKTDIKKQKLLKVFEDIKELTLDLSFCWHIEEDELDDEERWQLCIHKRTNIQKNGKYTKTHGTSSTKIIIK